MPYDPTIGDLFPIPPEVKRLEVFLGEWNVAGTVALDGRTLPVSGKWRFTPAASGQGLRASMRLELGPLGAYEEDDLIGYDAESGNIHVFRLTNTASVLDHTARWTDDRTLQMQYVRTDDGRAYREETTIRLQSPTSFTVRETDRYGDSVVSSMNFDVKKAANEGDAREP